MRIGDANDIIAFWLGGVAAGFAPAQGGTPADGEELFDVQGMPDESHLPPEDRRSLPEADSAGAVIPESDGFPGEESLERQASERRIRLFADPQAEASGQPSGSSSAPEASPPESEFAVPEVTEEEIYRVESPKKLYALDYLLAALIGLCGFGLVVATYSGIGMCWDEAYYYEPARKTLDWLGAMASSASKPISPAAIDAYFGRQFEDELHPELPMTPRLIFAFGLWLGEKLGIAPPYIAMRIPVAACFAVTLAALYLLAGKYYARAGAILTALCYLTIPRVFGHAHFAATETILVMFSVLMTYSFVQGLDRWPWAILTGVFFGFALATKINAIFFPYMLILWAHVFQRRFYVNNVFAFIFIAPAIMVAVWPWLWPSPFARFMAYVGFFASHKPIQTMYFGQLFPHISASGGIATAGSYPFIYAAFTTPVLVLALAVLGLARTAVHLKKHDIGVLFGLQALFPLAIAALPFSPKYDGVRLFLPVFAYLALMAGVGGEGLVAAIRGFRVSHKRYGPAHFFATILAVVVAGSGVIVISRYHPHELAHWNLLAGGLRGARAVGMETTYWGEAANEDVYRYLADLPKGTHVRPLALHDLTFRLLRDWGVFDPEDRTTPIIDVAPPGDVILLQARQGFFGPEEAFLYDAREEYGRTLTSLFGIPFVIAYDLRAHPDLKEKLRVFWPPDAIAPSSPGPPDDGANAGEPGAAP